MLGQILCVFGLKSWRKLAAPNLETQFKLLKYSRTFKILTILYDFLYISETTLLWLYFAGIIFREFREFLNVKFREDLISRIFPLFKFREDLISRIFPLS